MRRMSAIALAVALCGLWLILSVPACVPQLCDVDFDCEAPTAHCLVGRCVACLRDADCQQFFRCENNACVAPEGYVPEPRDEVVPPEDGSVTPEPSDETGGDGPPSERTPPSERRPPTENNGEPPADSDPPETPAERTKPPDLRPACTNGETRPCYTPKSGCTQQVDGSFQCTSPCRAGTQSCENGAWSTTCTGQRGPGEPRCDTNDRDCDGKPDTCKAVVPTDLLLDYAVNDKGHLMGLTRLNTNNNQKATLKVHCADSIRPSAVPRTLILANTDTTSATSTRLLTARILSIPGKDNFLLVWSISQTKPSLLTKSYVRSVGVDCKLDASPKWERDNVQNPSIAVDAQGRLAIMHTDFRSVNGMFQSNAYLRLFDAAGKQTLAHSLFPNSKGCLFPGHVAMNTKGQGVVACRLSVSPFQLTLHKFTMPATASAPITVPNSGGGLTFSYDPYLMPGINEKGDIVVQWQNPQQAKSYAYFRTAAGKVTQPTLTAKGGRVTPTTNPYSLQTNARIGIIGDDFILQDMPATVAAPGSWFRYSPDGQLVKKTSLPAFPSSLRVYGNYGYFLKPTTYHIFRIKNPF